MKNYTLIYLLLIIASNLRAQKINDSINITIDTINIHGKVIDERGNPVKNAKVLSETFDKNLEYTQTITDKNGLFKLNGIVPTNWIRVRTPTTAIVQPINGSRFLLLILSPFPQRDLNKESTIFEISAKRIQQKNKYTYKSKDSIIYEFHPFGYAKSAEYPGGLIKFYDFVKSEIKYPQKAIENNIEGLVIIKFRIDTLGNYKNFDVIQDIGYGCSEEVIRTIKKSKKWNPAINGLVVEQSFTIAIPFKLID